MTTGHTLPDGARAPDAPACWPFGTVRTPVPTSTVQPPPIKPDAPLRHSDLDNLPPALF